MKENGIGTRSVITNPPVTCVMLAINCSLQASGLSTEEEEEEEEGEEMKRWR